MRISTMQAYRSGLAGITKGTAEVNRTQQQVATGRRLQTAADDPVAAARVLRLQQDISLRERYQQNIDAADTRLNYADATLNQATEVLQRVRELGIQARGPALSQQDRESLAIEISARLEEMVSLLNSPDGSGDYLFGGFQTEQPPFQKDAGGRYIYTGDEGVREQQISETIRVPVTESGKHLFVDVPAAATTVTPRELPGSSNQGRLIDVQVLDQDTLDAYAPDDLVVRFNDLADVAPPGANFTVVSARDGRVVDGLANRPYVQGAGVQAAGVSFELHGEPAPGDAFTLETSQSQDLLTTIANLELDLLRPISEDSTGFENAVANLDLALDRILEVRSSLGARMNTVESVAELHQDVNLLAQTTLSSLQDIDYAEAVSRLNLQSFVLEAAQQSYARIANLSLFNSL